MQLECSNIWAKYLEKRRLFHEFIFVWYKVNIDWWLNILV